MVFQEPMTSLNPLHTLEQQVGETLLIHSRMSPARRASGCSSCCTWSASRGGKPARRLSASALGRPAPAGDDRDGDRQRARHPDRRRADDGPRRDDPGADPGPVARFARPARHGAAVDHPRSDDRPPYGRARLRDDRGRDRRERADRGDLRSTAPSLHPAAARRRAEGPGRAGRSGRTSADRGRAAARCGSRSGAACCAGSGVTSRRSTAFRSSCAPAGRWASLAKVARARRPGSGAVAADRVARADPLCRAGYRPGAEARCGRCGARCRSSFRTRFRASRHACRSRRSSRRGCGSIASRRALPSGGS